MKAADYIIASNCESQDHVNTIALLLYDDYEMPNLISDINNHPIISKLNSIA